MKKTSDIVPNNIVGERGLHSRGRIPRLVRLRAREGSNCAEPVKKSKSQTRGGKKKDPCSTCG